MLTLNWGTLFNFCKHNLFDNHRGDDIQYNGTTLSVILVLDKSLSAFSR